MSFSSFRLFCFLSSTNIGKILVKCLLYQLKSSSIIQASESSYSKSQILENGSISLVVRYLELTQVEGLKMSSKGILLTCSLKKKSHWQLFVFSKTRLSNTLSCKLKNIFNSREKPFSTQRNPFCSKLINFCFVHKSKILCQTLCRNPFSYLKKYIWCSPGWFLLYGQKFTLSNYILQKAFQLT